MTLVLLETSGVVSEGEGVGLLVSFSCCSIGIIVVGSITVRADGFATGGRKGTCDKRLEAFVAGCSTWDCGSCVADGFGECCC